MDFILYLLVGSVIGLVLLLLAHALARTPGVGVGEAWLSLVMIVLSRVASSMLPQIAAAPLKIVTVLLAYMALIIGFVVVAPIERIRHV